MHRDEDEHGDRDRDGEDDLRQIARERGLERVEAGDRGRRHLGALDAVERGRTIAEPPLDQLDRSDAKTPVAAQRPSTSKPDAATARRPRRQRADASSTATPSRSAPPKTRAATAAIRTAWARTSSAAATPSAASSASSARTAPARRTRRRSSPPIVVLGAGLAWERSAGDGDLVTARAAPGRRGTSSPGRAGSAAARSAPRRSSP